MFSIDCRSYNGQIGEKRKANYELSDIIFLGVLTEIDGSVGKIKISEVYKGIADKVAVVKFDNPIKKEDVYCLWLIYGMTKYSNDTIFINECSLTRSVRVDVYPPPPPLYYSKNRRLNKFMSELEDYKLYIRSYLLFFEEVELLRILKK